MIDLQALKARVDLRDLVQETRQLTKGSKTHCLWHDDNIPSLHIYPNGYYCFVCGASGDHLDWLMATRELLFQEALEVLARAASVSASNSPTIKTFSSSEAPSDRYGLEPHQLETHRRRAAKLREIPEVLMGRGFTLADCKLLGIVNENGNAIFPVVGPDGDALAFKCRYAVPDPHRYEYITPGRGTPAWCSPDIRASDTILVVEGELNGMICWLALRGQKNQVGVMGTAGAHGSLHLEVFENKSVYIYADEDTAGEDAQHRWAKQVLGANANEAFLLEPWPVDACDIAGALGKAGLRKRLTWARKRRFAPSQAFGAAEPTGAPRSATNLCPPLSAKPDLVQWCSRSTGFVSALPPFLSLTPHTHYPSEQSCHDVA